MYIYEFISPDDEGAVCFLVKCPRKMSVKVRFSIIYTSSFTKATLLISVLRIQSMWFMLFVRKFLFTVLIYAFFFFFPLPSPPPPPPQPPPPLQSPTITPTDSTSRL